MNIENKKKEFFEEFCIFGEVNDKWGWDMDSPDKIWQWIESLIEEVKKEQIKNVYYKMGVGDNKVSNELVGIRLRNLFNQDKTEEKQYLCVSCNLQCEVTYWDSQTQPIEKKIIKSIACKNTECGYFGNPHSTGSFAHMCDWKYCRCRE